MNTQNDFSNHKPSYYFKTIIAGKKIEINCNYKTVLKQCRFYLNEFETPDIVIYPQSVVDNVIDKYIDIPVSKFEDVAIHPALGEIESLDIYFEIANKMLEYDIVLFHGAAISLDNKCYIFIAPSGTGKTTHILNWCKVYSNVTVVNGDKPLVDVKQKIVYGTPWCGKENMNANTSASLAGIIALERGVENSISFIRFNDFIPYIIRQVYIPDEEERAIKIYKLINYLKDVPCYKLTCNMDEESARIAYDGIVANEERLYGNN